MLLGIVVGVILVSLNAQQFATDWIKPFGVMFINSLKLIAIPLIVASLIKGVSDIQDISQLSSMGGRTIGLYLFTTVVAICVGLVVVNVGGPGNGITEETREGLIKDFKEKANAKIAAAESQKESGPLQPLVDIVPDNIFKAATSNGEMLKVIFYVIFFGIGLILVLSLIHI